MPSWQPTWYDHIGWLYVVCETIISKAMITSWMPWLCIWYNKSVFGKENRHVVRLLKLDPCSVGSDRTSGRVTRYHQRGSRRLKNDVRQNNMDGHCNKWGWSNVSRFKRPFWYHPHGYNWDTVRHWKMILLITKDGNGKTVNWWWLWASEFFAITVFLWSTKSFSNVSNVQKKLCNSGWFTTNETLFSGCFAGCVFETMLLTLKKRIFSERTPGPS